VSESISFLTYFFDLWSFNEKQAWRKVAGSASRFRTCCIFLCLRSKTVQHIPGFGAYRRDATLPETNEQVRQELAVSNDG